MFVQFVSSAQLFTLLNSDDEGEDAAPFGRDASASLGASSWRAPDAPGTSQFEVGNPFRCHEAVYFVFDPRTVECLVIAS